MVPEYSAVWHVGPHLDLMSSEGAFVRAYMEALDWAFATRDVRNLPQSVIDASAFDVREMVLSQIPSGEQGLEYRGAVDYFVAEVAGPPERTQVTVCASYAREGNAVAGGFLVNPDPDHPTVMTRVLVFDTSGEAPPAGLSGPENAAPSDVFGGWRALEYVHIPLHERGDAAEEKCRRVLDLPGDPFDGLAAVTTVPSVPEVAPSPGWPKGPESSPGQL